jgi:peroxiredoxin
MLRIMGSLTLMTAGLFLFTQISCSQSDGQVSNAPPPKKIIDQTNLKEAPDFTLTDLSGQPVTLSEHRGKVVLLDFWATWCPPCRKEIPHFVELYDQYRDQGLEIIGISLDQAGVETVQKFAEEYQINYPVVMGHAEVAGSYGGIRGIPTTFAISREGKIVETYVGYRDREVFESIIKSLL